MLYLELLAPVSSHKFSSFFNGAVKLLKQRKLETRYDWKLDLTDKE